jgi:hypothetical protein
MVRVSQCGPSESEQRTSPGGRVPRRISKSGLALSLRDKRERASRTTHQPTVRNGRPPAGLAGRSGRRPLPAGATAVPYAPLYIYMISSPAVLENLFLTNVMCFLLFQFVALEGLNSGVPTRTTATLTPTTLRNIEQTFLELQPQHTNHSAGFVPPVVHHANHTSTSEFFFKCIFIFTFRFK